jgi:hypothetical protein
LGQHDAQHVNLLVGRRRLVFCVPFEDLSELLLSQVMLAKYLADQRDFDQFRSSPFDDHLPRAGYVDVSVLNFSLGGWIRHLD